MRREMEMSALLFCQGCAPWEGVLLTGKVATLTGGGEEHRGMLEFPKENKIKR